MGKCGYRCSYVLSANSRRYTRTWLRWIPSSRSQSSSFRKRGRWRRIYRIRVGYSRFVCAYARFIFNSSWLNFIWYATRVGVLNCHENKNATTLDISKIRRKIKNKTINSFKKDDTTIWCKIVKIVHVQNKNVSWSLIYLSYFFFFDEGGLMALVMGRSKGSKYIYFHCNIQ